MTTDTGALTTDSEALVRRAYHLAEGDVL
ncbi:MAG: hypothetical protein JWR85_3973, partial [Marmoricola sp.]|nr:hypothetical protein [Marmoricola sp.]